MKFHGSIYWDSQPRRIRAKGRRLLSRQDFREDRQQFHRREGFIENGDSTQLLRDWEHGISQSLS